MLSWRLWRTIAEADINNPIFRRVSQIQKPALRPARRIGRSRLPLLLALLALVASLLHSPQLLIVIFVLPILMITLMVMAPLLLPFVIWLAGASATAEVISGIYREKYQYTYDLICASTPGKLKASWSFATGILYRGGWLQLIRWGTRASLRLGLAALGGLTILALLLVVSGSHRVGFEQLRLLLLPALIMTAIYANMTQTFVLSQVIGLYASSFDWAKRDATLVGLVAYLLLSVLPLVAAGLVYFAFGRLAHEPSSLMRLIAESFALLLIVALRELVIALLWSGLKRRLNASRGESAQGEIPLFRAA